MRPPKIPTPAFLLFAIFSILALGAAAGCASILGIKEFSEGADGGPAGSSSSGGGEDVVEPPDAPLPSGDDGSNPIPDAGPADVDLGPEISAPPPPPVGGKAGFDITAGGNVSTSTNYKLIGSVGEAPGGNVVSKSTSYTLKGGLVAATQ
jgi:hypothetical protein